MSLPAHADNMLGNKHSYWDMTVSTWYSILSLPIVSTLTVSALTLSTLILLMLTISASTMTLSSCMSLPTHAHNLPGNKHNCSDVMRPTRDKRETGLRQPQIASQALRKRKCSQLSGELGAIEEIPASWIDGIPVILNNRHIPSWFFAACYKTLLCLLVSQTGPSWLQTPAKPNIFTGISLTPSKTNCSSVCVCVRSQQT